MTLHKSEELPTDINRIKVLLLFLYAPGPSGQPNEPVQGRTRIQKQAFLIQQELKQMGAKSLYAFRPYKIGPMSYELSTDLDWLAFEETIRERNETLPDGREVSQFALTDKGINEVRKLLVDSKWFHLLEHMKEIKQATNALNLSRLVDAVHQAHPEYMLQTSLVKLLKSFSEETGLSPTEVNASFIPRKRSVPTSVVDEVRAIRSTARKN